jgi:hypothetical protein
MLIIGIVPPLNHFPTKNQTPSHMHCRRIWAKLSQIKQEAIEFVATAELTVKRRPVLVRLSRMEDSIWDAVKGLVVNYPELLITRRLMLKREVYTRDTFYAKCTKFFFLTPACKRMPRTSSDLTSKCSCRP